MPDSLRAALDTNVVLAARLSPHATSPTAEILDRWQQREFRFLYSLDTLAEYAEKFPLVPKWNLGASQKLTHSLDTFHTGWVIRSFRFCVLSEFRKVGLNILL